MHRNRRHGPAIALQTRREVEARQNRQWIASAAAAQPTDPHRQRRFDTTKTQSGSPARYPSPLLAPARYPLACCLMRSSMSGPNSAPRSRQIPTRCPLGAPSPVAGSLGYPRSAALRERQQRLIARRAPTLPARLKPLLSHRGVMGTLSGSARLASPARVRTAGQSQLLERRHRLIVRLDGEALAGLVATLRRLTQAKGEAGGVQERRQGPERPLRARRRPSHCPSSLCFVISSNESAVHGSTEIPSSTAFSGVSQFMLSGGALVK